jgi:hypothetical protein
MVIALSPVPSGDVDEGESEEEEDGGQRPTDSASDADAEGKWFVKKEADAEMARFGIYLFVLFVAQVTISLAFVGVHCLRSPARYLIGWQMGVAAVLTYLAPNLYHIDRSTNQDDASFRGAFGCLAVVQLLCFLSLVYALHILLHRVMWHYVGSLRFAPHYFAHNRLCRCDL